MVIAPKIHRHLPGSILAIILVTVIASLASLPLARIGQLPPALPAPHLPAMDAAMLQALVAPALTVAALAAIESLLSARVAASIPDTGPYDPDRALAGQGPATAAAGMIDGKSAGKGKSVAVEEELGGGRNRQKTK